MIDRVQRRLITNKKLLLLLAGSMAVAPSLLSQTSAASSGAVAVATTDIKLPTFDVVSVKLNKSGDGRMRTMFKPDGYSATNVPLKLLIQMAYGIRQDLISGGPDWVESEGYDFDAKVAGPDLEEWKKLSPKQRGSMLQSVLQDRFKLKAHTETKQLPVFDLLVAKGGPKMKEAIPGDTYANGVKGPDGVARGGMMRMGRGQVTGQALPMTSIVNMLAQQLHRTVIDKTGLTGKYDLELNWTPEEGEGMGPPPPAGGPQHADPSSDSSGPSIFTAVQEQLGLKLQSAKGPVETLVIDNVEKPSEN